MPVRTIASALALSIYASASFATPQPPDSLGLLPTAAANEAVALEELLSLLTVPEGTTLTDIADTSENGTVLGMVQREGQSEPELFVWLPGQEPLVLTLPEGTTLVQAVDVSDSGHVVARVQDPDGQETAVLFRPDGTVQPLKSVEDTPAKAAAVNAEGDVVGMSPSPEDASPYAVLWDSTGTALDLNTALLSGLPETYRLVRADDVNNSGQIAAYAMDENGAFYGVTLTPVETDEPVDTPDRLYQPEIVGLFPNRLETPALPPMIIAENGNVVSPCEMIGVVCPEDTAFASIDPEIVNFFVPTGENTGPTAFLPLDSGRLGGTSTTPTVGTDTTGLAPSNGTGRGNTPSNFGATSLPAVVDTSNDGGTANATTLPASVPLPAGIWSLLAALTLLLRPLSVLRVHQARRA